MRGEATPASRERLTASQAAAACAAASIAATGGAWPSVTNAQASGMRAVQARPSTDSRRIDVRKRIGTRCGNNASSPGNADSASLEARDAAATPRDSSGLPSRSSALATRSPLRFNSMRRRPVSSSREESSSRSPGRTSWRNLAKAMPRSETGRPASRASASTARASSATPGRMGRPGKWPSNQAPPWGTLIVAFTRAGPRWRR